MLTPLLEDELAAGDAVAALRRYSLISPPADGAAGQLIATARDRFGRLDGALISVGGSPGGTLADTGDDA